jgi:hypothetical protein
MRSVPAVRDGPLVAAYDESVTRERSARDFHTRLGWWVMTHPRGGAALIGWVAVAALAVGAGYVAHQWHGLDSSFHRAFVIGAVGMWLVGFVADRLGVAEPLGADRVRARHRARSIAKLHAPIPFAVIAAGYAFGNYVMVGLILGGLLILFGLFAISALREVVRPHVAAGATRAGRP